MSDEERGYRQERPLADIIPPDRRRLRAVALVLGGMIAGAALFVFAQHLVARAEAPPPAVLTHPTRVQAFRIGAALADITSPRPGAIASDGKKDQAFDLFVDGPISAIVIASCDSTGRPYGNQRWGTIDHDPHTNAGPLVLGAPPTTAWQLAVFENQDNRNDPAGALHPFGDGYHQLRVYASDSGAFDPGSYFRAYVFASDGSVSSSDVLAFTGHGPAHYDANPPVPPPVQTPTAAPFDRGAAAAALRAVDVNRCRFAPGVDGTGHVHVTFSNDGSVTAASVDQGGNTTTPRGTCIAREFKKVKIPPFQGAPVSVGKSFEVEATTGLK